MKITTILGTRPETIRMSSIIKRLDLTFEHRLVHTGQNSDPNLSEVFFRELNMRKPDSQLTINNHSLGLFLGDLLPAIEFELKTNKPDAVVVLGDTNSAFAGIIAKRMGIPVYHLEAGNRAFDPNVPEEINRRIIDHFADFNLVYTQNAKENLLREGIHPRNVALIGSPLCEVLSEHNSAIASSKVLNYLNLEQGGFFLVSAHRQENIDNSLRLMKLMDSLNDIAIKFGIPLIISTHPRTKNKLKELNLELNPLLLFHQPFGFIDYCRLQKDARVVLSDSGSVSEESVILGFKAITIRDSMERPEAIDSGSILMSGLNSADILRSIEIIESGSFSKSPPAEYLIPDTSNRVTNFIASTIHQHNFWSGLRAQ
jgi:UDP-N-acetylglucosamine 2-epimerase